MHSFYPYSEKTNKAILNFNFDKITLYSDGIKNLIHPLNISAKMNIANLLYFGWIDNSRFKDLNGINFSIVPWVALRSIYELAASFIHEDHLKKIGMSKLKADDFLLIQRYYGKGVYSFETESSEKEFIQLLANELYKNFPADSIVICPDSRCSLAFNNYCSLAFEKYYGIVNTINPSADDEGFLMECLLSHYPCRFL